MSGISKQVGRYKAAANTRNMGSQPSAEQALNSKQTAIGGRNIPARRGSWEGYQSGHSTHIQMNGTGYDSQQNARSNPRRPTDFSSVGSHPSSGRSAGSSNVFDYTYSGSAGNSVSMMRRQRALDQSRNR